ncbi:MAG: 16S rRNA (guanine(527)-N(7))-methyltransferase RsmG [Clostridia bacterium]|nr:16S rRNA (guanine(527)-N(7))-methyltransferase RsmG [Clostridia bacterium]
MDKILNSYGAIENAEKFEKYYELLVEWNNKFNLTAITERDEVKVKHFADSLVANRFIKSGDKVLDIGAGAGFPSLPIKIIRDDIDLTMLDSVNKKVGFLSEVISALNLNNARAIHTRVEDYGQKESFDIVLSRAVASLNTLCEYALPFVKVGGLFIAYKSEKTDEEVALAKSAIEILGGEIIEITTETVADGITRRLVVIKKVSSSPKKYPRGKNLPRVKPL